jgi:hypothetical protein
MAGLQPDTLFPTDEPVSPDQLIGRADDVATVAASLQAGANVVIAAPRRTGKTTVCDAAMEKLKAEGFYVAAVDLWGVADASELSEAIVAQTIANRGPIRRMLHQVKAAGRSALSNVGLQTTIKAMQGDLGDDVEIAWKPGLAAKDPQRYFDYAIKLPQRVATQDDRRLVLFFDEFQNIKDYEETGRDKDEHALQKRMRAVFQRSKNVSFLFAGSMEHMMKDIFAPTERPFSQFGGFHELQPITADAWRVGVRERLAKDSRTIDDVALDRLIELGELHPRATMLIAQQADIAARIGGTRQITPALVETGHVLARQRDRGKHEQTVDRIRKLGGKKTSRKALQMARLISRGEPLYPGVTIPTDVQRAVRALHDAGIIESRSKGQGWIIIDPLLRNYLTDLDHTAV